MARITKAFAYALILVLSGIVAGCMTPPKPAAPVRTVVEPEDPCPKRLHELCGRLLEYYVLHDGWLPGKIEDLNDPKFGPTIPLVCPTTGKPYFYYPDGLQLINRAGRLIVVEVQPCGPPTRWGILLVMRPGRKPLPSVIRVKEDEIIWQDEK